MGPSKQNLPIIEFDGCQLPCVPNLSIGLAHNHSPSLYVYFKRSLSYPWNYFVKKWLKKIYYFAIRLSRNNSTKTALIPFAHENSLVRGDKVRVRSLGEIMSTLDPFNELKGCSFLSDMKQYCGTEQRVFRSMRYFLDERDYKLKKTRGLVLLENVFCNGTPAFGACDRSCFLFWREEWMEKVE